MKHHKYKDVRIHDKHGKFVRTQRAMVLASGKLKFVPNTTKKKSHGGASHASKKKGTHVAKSKAMTKTKKKHHSPAKKHHRRRKHGGGGHLPLFPLALAGVALGFMTANPNSPASIKDTLAKVPGAKTFGTAAVVGAAALATDRWLWKNKYVRIAGYIGIGIAALSVGATIGTDKFKWVGDEESSGDYDLADEESGDEESGDDDMGDDDMSDVGDDE